MGCEIGKLNRIKKCIPKITHKELYHTLFESHLSYGISAWGGISFKKLEPLFITQRKCLRIMLGDNEAYHNKFKTAARVRPRELQKLGAEFHELEHSKPLFNKNNLLTVHHLYNYFCLLEMFKIIKLRIPIALYSLFTRSNRRENYFITNSPSTSFINHMWNNCYRVSESTNIDFSSAVAKLKKIMKFALLRLQTMKQ